MLSSPRALGAKGVTPMPTVRGNRGPPATTLRTPIHSFSSQHCYEVLLYLVFGAGDSLKYAQWNELTPPAFKGFSTSGHGCYRCLDALSKRIKSHPADRVNRVKGSAFNMSSPSALGCMPHEHSSRSVSFYIHGNASKCENMCFKSPHHRCRAWTATHKDCCRFTFASELVFQAGEAVGFPALVVGVFDIVCDVNSSSRSNQASRSTRQQKPYWAEFPSLLLEATSAS